MNRRPKIPMTEQAKQALADIGGEPLAGSGFEDETPEARLRDDNDILNAPAGEMI